jgi:hypothetical protein
MKRWKRELNQGKSPEEVAGGAAGRPPRAAVEATKVKAALKAAGPGSTVRDLVNAIRGPRKGGPQAGGSFGRLPACALRLRLTAGAGREDAFTRRRAEARLKRRQQTRARRAERERFLIAYLDDFLVAAKAAQPVVDGQRRFSGYYVDGSLILNRLHGSFSRATSLTRIVTNFDAILPGQIIECKKWPG